MADHDIDRFVSHLKGLEHYRSMGFVGAARIFLDSSKFMLSVELDETLRTRLASVLDWLEWAEHYEAEHGAGCLMKVCDLKTRLYIRTFNRSIVRASLPVKQIVMPTWLIFFKNLLVPRAHLGDL